MARPIRIINPATTIVVNIGGNKDITLPMASIIFKKLIKTSKRNAPPGAKATPGGFVIRP